MPEDYSSNSKKSREAQKPGEPERDRKFEPMTTGLEKKPSMAKRIATSFTGDDSKSVGEYVILEVMIPAVKAMIADSLTQGVERVLFGGSRNSARSSSTQRGGTNYSKFARSGEKRDISKADRSGHEFNDILLDDRGTAEAILEKLVIAIEEYQFVAVADFYDLVNITPGFQDTKWGWFSLATAKVRRVSDGYVIDLPRPEQQN